MNSAATPHVRITPTQLSDGRELIYFDDTAEYVDGTKTRNLDDSRDLPPAIAQCEMRLDPLTGQWAAYASHRMNRTFMPPAGEDPLAPTLPGSFPTEIPADDYDVVVFENRFPSFSTHMDLADGNGATFVDEAELYEKRPAVSRCEVICFTPDARGSFKDLSVQRIETVIEAWAHRTKALSAIPEVAHVFPFENRGEEIGVTLQHPHGQIYSYPFVPPRIAQIVDRSRAYKEKTGGDLFQAIVDSERQEKSRIISEGDHFTIFVPAAAKWPVEVMVMPTRHVSDFTELKPSEKAELARILKKLYTSVDRFFDGVDNTPYIASWNQAPCREEDGHSDVRLHLQLFSLMRSPGRMKFLAGSESAMGVWINDTTPEKIAERFREIW